VKNGGGAHDIEGMHRERSLTELGERAGLPAERKHPVVLVDDGALLGDKVHAVAKRIDQQDVRDTESGDGRLKVVGDLECDRQVVRRTKPLVNARDDVLDFAAVGEVFGQFFARAVQAGEKDHPALPGRS
jgi:hypothetical protein